MYLYLKKIFKNFRGAMAPNHACGSAISYQTLKKKEKKKRDNFL